MLRRNPAENCLALCFTFRKQKVATAVLHLSKICYACIPLTQSNQVPWKLVSGLGNRNIVRTLLYVEIGEVLAINSRVHISVNHFLYPWQTTRRHLLLIFNAQQRLMQYLSAWKCFVTNTECRLNISCASFASVTIVCHVTVKCCWPQTRIVVCLIAPPISGGRPVFCRHRNRRHMSFYLVVCFIFMRCRMVLLFCDSWTVKNIGFCRFVVC